MHVEAEVDVRCLYYCIPMSILRQVLSLNPELSLLSSLASLLVPWWPDLCLLCAEITGSCHNCPAFYMVSGTPNLSDQDRMASTFCSESSSLCYSLKNTTIISYVLFYIILLSISFTFLLEAELLAGTILKVIYNSPLSGQSTIYIIILLLIFIAIINYVVVRMYCFNFFNSIFMITGAESWGRIT